MTYFSSSCRKNSARPGFRLGFAGLATQLAIGMVIATTGLLTVAQSGQAQSSFSCPSALDRMRNHTVASGDTLESIAATYRLSAVTVARFNPEAGNTPAVGSTLLIPPFNGSVVNVAGGESWQSLAKRYGSRADVLFEMNGCVADVPQRVFLPGAPGSSLGGESIAHRPATTQTLGYPLAENTSIVRSYGWQPHSTRDELVFNSGIAFGIPRPNEVLAAGSGTVAFAGSREGYGQLVVINHAEGLQTRYANLGAVSVSVGQSVSAATSIGQVGVDNEPTYLYFEVRTNSESGWVAQDPGQYVAELELR